MIAYHPVPVLDRFSGEPEEPKTIGICDHCEQDILSNEEHVNTNAGWVHEDCFYDFARAVLDAKFSE